MKLRSLTRFWKLYFVFVGVAGVLLLVGFFVFYGFMSSYERSQPQDFAARYAAALSTEDLLDLAADLLPTVRSPYEDDADVREAYFSALTSLEGDFSVRRNFRAYTADKPVFYLTKGGVTVAEISLVPDADGAFGLPRWKLLSIIMKTEEWAPQKNEYVFYVPEGGVLSLNGVSVPPEDITGADIHYAYASVHVPAGSVSWDVYAVGDLYGKPAFSCVLNGESCPASAEGASVHFRYPDSMMKTYTVTAPADALVWVNGVELTGESITAANIPYDYSALEGALAALPTAVTYTIEGLFAPPEVMATLQGTHLTILETDNDGYIADYPASHLYTCTIRVPAGSTVSVHGKDCSLYKTASEPVFSELTDQIFNMPVYDVYTISGLYASPEGAVFVYREGETLPLTISVDSYDVLCTAKFREIENPLLDDLASDFLVDYITYTGKGYAGINENLSKVLSYILEDSETYTRIKNSREAISLVTPVLKTEYNKKEIVSSVKYTDDLWEYAIEFDIEQNTAGYLREYVGTFHLVFAKTGDNWKIADLKIVTK